MDGDAEKASDASNVVGDAPEEQNQEEENEEEENEEDVGEDEEVEEEENTDDEEDVSCQDRRIDSDLLKCDIACEEAGLLGSLRKRKKADWVEQGGGFAVCNLNQLSSTLRGGVQDIADKLRLTRAGKESLVVRVDYGTGEAVNMAVPLHSVLCYALGTEQRMAVGDSNGHIVRCKRLAPCIVKGNSRRHLSVKRNSRSYSYAGVFPTKKGQTLQIERAVPSSGGKNVLNDRRSTRALTKQSIALSNTIKEMAGKIDHMEKTVNALKPLAEAMDKLTADATQPQNKKQKAKHQSQSNTQSTAPLTVPWPWLGMCTALLP